MKKVLVLSLFAMAVFVSQAIAVDMCMWDPTGGCWPLPNAEGKGVADCEREAWHFDGGTQGAATFCEGGTFVAGKDNNPPRPGTVATSLGCCKWAGDTKCYNIYTSTDVTNCTGTSQLLSTAACPDTQGACPGETPGGGGGGSATACQANGQQVFCQYTWGCYALDSEHSGIGEGASATCGTATTAKCSCTQLLNDCDTQGTRYSGVNKTTLDAANYGTGERCSDHGGTPASSPILSGSSVANLTVLAQAGSLAISSAKEASVKLFDMRGNQVVSQKVSAGYNIVSFENQKQGVYYAVVTSGSSKQTVKVLLK